MPDYPHGPSVDHLFVSSEQNIPDDFIDMDSDETKQDARINNEMRSDWSREIERDIAKEDLDPAHNPAQSADTKYKRSSVQAYVEAVGAHRAVTGGRVLLSSSNKRFGGMVIAEGTSEFCVRWNDGTYTVEPKSAYTLVK